MIDLKGNEWCAWHSYDRTYRVELLLWLGQYGYHEYMWVIDPEYGFTCIYTGPSQ